MGDLQFVRARMRCPYCKSPDLSSEFSADELVCKSCDSHYPITFGRPILIRGDNELFHPNDYRSMKLPNVGDHSSYWKRVIPSPSVNLSSQRVLLKVREMLEEKPSSTVLVVGGGHQRHWLNDRLGDSNSMRIIYSDIDSGADVDLFCDGHDLPFVDGVFDAVVTTAVLEHVMYPERVAAEITRVLLDGGLLYSELPFMQQVHEGAYDFTRYTMSGHKRLFNSFSIIESGMVAGPGTALVWALEGFFVTFATRPLCRKLVKAITRLLFGWIKYFDFLLANKPAAMDSASCTYLLGRKIDRQVSDTEIIAQYIGAQGLRHT